MGQDGRTIAILIDAGFVYACADQDDDHHVACLNVAQQTSDELRIPVLAIAEAAYLLLDRLGVAAELRLIQDVSGGTLIPEPPDPADWTRIEELLRTYRDMRLGTADASIIAAAERLNITTIGTTDRRHFLAVRPRHTVAFDLLP